MVTLIQQSTGSIGSGSRELAAMFRLCHGEYAVESGADGLQIGAFGSPIYSGSEANIQLVRIELWHGKPGVVVIPVTAQLSSASGASYGRVVGGGQAEITFVEISFRLPFGTEIKLGDFNQHYQGYFNNDPICSSTAYSENTLVHLPRTNIPARYNPNYELAISMEDARFRVVQTQFFGIASPFGNLFLPMRRAKMFLRDDKVPGVYRLCIAISLYYSPSSLIQVY